MNRSIYTLIVAFTVLCGVVSAQIQPQPAKPKLVVQIVISQMRIDYLDRFSANFSDKGFNRLMSQGAYCNNAQYDYMLTSTAAGLGTISTGANPSSHGIIADMWYNYTTKEMVDLIADREVTGLNCDDGVGKYSPRNLITGTIADRLKQSDPKSKSISVAADAMSSIISGGYNSDAYWLDKGRGQWISSTFYFDTLKYWVAQYNLQNYPASFLDRKWELSMPITRYVNTEKSTIDEKDNPRIFSKDYLKNVFKKIKGSEDVYNNEALHYTPAANAIVNNFAQQAIIYEDLGKDSHTDLLTICFDTPRVISQRFGPTSVEVEDMYYQLDRELGDLLDFIFAQVDQKDVVVMLTSDHGSSDKFNEDARAAMGQFNVDQFKMIMNGFLSAQYESANWIVEYKDRQLYLNRELIYNLGFDLEEIQNRAATFALQFRGVANSLTSTAMQNNSYASSFGHKMQNSFYPKRSGDVTINLMPGWIEQIDGEVSRSGSLYGYDTHVPLFFIGGGIAPMKINRKVDIIDVAPTLARIMQITPPNASEGSVIEEVVQR